MIPVYTVVSFLKKIPYQKYFLNLINFPNDKKLILPKGWKNLSCAVLIVENTTKSQRKTKKNCVE